ncbi:MAG: peptidoglycan DD-metalloendopeptidase family protein [Candidatus Promineifilaceae bacterium]
MENNQPFFQRYSGYLVLLVAVLMLAFGGRMIAGDGRTTPSDTEETGLEPTQPAEQPEEAPTEEDTQPAQEVASLSGVPLLVNNSIAPRMNPYTFEGRRPEPQYITYTVQPLDTPIGIADQFGIQSETILGANPQLSEEANALQPGAVIKILPIDGVLHDVVEGDSLESVSNLYGIPQEDIIAYEPNNLEFPYRLYPDTQIVVPGAVREVFVWTAPTLPAASSGSTGSGISPLIQGTGTFIWPVTNHRITQAYWYGHPAIDIGVPEGSAVVASDTGTVTWAGWNVYGYGNLIVINHGNGYETYYAHLSSFGVVPGQIVYQGSYIGASGNTGHSSGPHLHFEIRYFNSQLNPLSFIP